MSEHLPLSQLELNKLSGELCSKFLIASRTQEPSGKPCYYIDPKLTVNAVRNRLMAMQKKIDARIDPMEKKTMRCRHCDPPLSQCKSSLSFGDLDYPRGYGGFVCPRCNAELELLPLPTSSSTLVNTTMSEDLNYFLQLLKEAEQACKAASHAEIMSWSQGTEVESVN